MRLILVFLICGLVLWPGNEAFSTDLLLVEIVSVDKEAEQAVVQILDGPESQGGLPDVGKRLTLHSETLAATALPGEIFRLWVDAGETGKEPIVKEAIRSADGADPTGVRRRLRNNIQKLGQGRRGGGRGGS